MPLLLFIKFRHQKRLQNNQINFADHKFSFRLRCLSKNKNKNMEYGIYFNNDNANENILATLEELENTFFY